MFCNDSLLAFKPTACLKILFLNNISLFFFSSKLQCSSLELLEQLDPTRSFVYCENRKLVKSLQQRPLCRWVVVLNYRSFEACHLVFVGDWLWWLFKKTSPICFFTLGYSTSNLHLHLSMMRCLPRKYFRENNSSRTPFLIKFNVPYISTLQNILWWCYPANKWLHAGK